jgi:hypothetical protein
MKSCAIELEQQALAAAPQHGIPGHGEKAPANRPFRILSEWLRTLACGTSNPIARNARQQKTFRATFHRLIRHRISDPLIETHKAEIGARERRKKEWYPNKGAIKVPFSSGLDHSSMIHDEWVAQRARS